MRRISGQSNRWSSGQSTKSSSGQSSKSSSIESESSKAPPTDAMSSTAKLILETLDKMSTPLRDVSRVPTVTLTDRKRVAEELNASLGLGTASSARKRPRLGTGPLAGGGSSSPLGGPPFRKLYSPLSANRSRPPRVKHITPMASINHVNSSSRASTPTEMSGVVPPPAPPNNISLSSYSTPLSAPPGGTGGGKLRAKVSGRPGGVGLAAADVLENEEAAPPLPSYLTNNVPQLKVDAGAFSFGLTNNLSDKTSEKSKDADGVDVVSDKEEEEEDDHTDNSSHSTSSDDGSQGTSNNSPTSKSGGPPIFGLTQTVATTTASQQQKSSATTTTVENNNNKSDSTTKMFSFTSPVKTGVEVHQQPSNKSDTTFNFKQPPIAESTPIAKAGFVNSLLSKVEAKLSSIEEKDGEKKSDKPAVLVNGIGGMQFKFVQPKTVVNKTTNSDSTNSCSMLYSFSSPKMIEQGKKL